MKNKLTGLERRHRRLRVKIIGTTQRPRLIVKRTLNNLSAQIIDDVTGKTLFAGSTSLKELKSKLGAAGNVKAAEVFGLAFAQKSKEKGITKVVFDRSGYLYHGRVKAFADSLRKGGLEF